eukprot:SAG31_NODE_95_length_25901_cov_24.763700_8_plen_136_part_00
MGDSAGKVPQNRESNSPYLFASARALAPQRTSRSSRIGCVGCGRRSGNDEIRSVSWLQSGTRDTECRGARAPAPGWWRPLRGTAPAVGSQSSSSSSGGGGDKAEARMAGCTHGGRAAALALGGPGGAAGARGGGG